MKLNCVVESVPRLGIYVGMVLEKIDSCTNLQDAIYQIRQTSNFTVYVGANHVALHYKDRDGDIDGNRIAIITEHQTKNL